MSRGFIQGTWGPRNATVAELTEATCTLITALEPFLAFVDAPFGILEDAHIDTDITNLEVAFEAGRFVDDAGAPQPQHGFSCTLFTTTGTQNISLSIQAGATEPVYRVPSNTVMLAVDGMFPIDVFQTFAESNLLAIVDTFDPSFGWVAELTHLEANPVKPVIPGIGPFTYLADHFAAPPKVRGVTRARHGNGTLLRLKPRRGENVWTDPAPTERVIKALAKAGWAPSLEHRPPNPA